MATTEASSATAKRTLDTPILMDAPVSMDAPASMDAPVSMDAASGMAMVAPGSKRNPNEPWFDNYQEAPFSPDLYRYRAFAEGIESFHSFTEEHVRFFKENGYLVIRNAFNAQEVHDAIEGLLDLIDGQNPDFKGIQFELKARDRLKNLTRDEKQDVVRKLDRYVKFEPRLNAIAAHPRLLATVAQLVGATPELFADQAMLKPPKIGREKPWHQDHAFFDLPMGTQVVGTWIALDEAVPENGCMHIIPRGHKEPIIHFRRRDWQICDDNVDTDGIVAVPLTPGSLLFFDGLLPHGTPETRSDRRRRALQLHYIPTQTPKIPTEERMAVFGSEGKDVTC